MPTARFTKAKGNATVRRALLGVVVAVSESQLSLECPRIERQTIQSELLYVKTYNIINNPEVWASDTMKRRFFARSDIPEGLRLALHI